MPRTCVIYNPTAGRGKAEKVLKSLPPALLDGVELRPTAHAGHAEELARRAADDGVGRIAAAGGDGTMHEVANGILQANRPDVVMSVWPVGSANDYAYTLGMTAWWERRTELLPTEVLAVDVGRVTGGGQSRYAVGNLGLGFNGMVNLEARRTRWLSGLPLYAWAFLKSITRHYATPEMTVRLDDAETTGPTLALSVLLGQREGNFPLRPAASLTDGRFDIMHAADLPRWQLVRYLPAMATGRLPENHPRLRLARARVVGVRSARPLCVHVDGEVFCVPADGVRELTVETVPGRLRVEVYPPGLYGGRGRTGGRGA